MNQSRRASGWMGRRSLGMRLLLVVILPLVALQAFSIGNVRSQLRTERSSKNMVNAVALINDAGRIFAPAAVEQIGSDGLAEGDALAVSRQVVAELTGVAFEPLVSATRIELDAALGRLTQDFGSVVLTDGTRLAARLGDLQGRLATMRPTVDGRKGDRAVIDSVFSDLRGTLSDIVSASLRVDANVSKLNVLRERSARLVELLIVTSSTSIELAQAVASLPSDAGLRIATSDGRRRQAIDSYQHALDLNDQPAFADALREAGFARYDAAQTSYLAIVGSIIALSDAQAMTADPTYYRSAAALIQTNIEEMNFLQRYGVTVLDASLTEATAIGADAWSQVREAIALAAALTILTLILLGLTLRSIVVPLRRLTSTAIRLGSGELPSAPVRVTGPSDLRVVTRTFNGMVAMLVKRGVQMRALADGDLDDPVLNEELPGSMGKTLSGSIRRLTSVTARLKHSEALASAIVDTAADAIWTIDRDGCIVSANACAERMIGVDEREQVGLALARFVSTTAGEREVRRADGSIIAVLVSTSVVTAEPSPLYTVFARDISERKHFENQLAEQARLDGLTKLPNRFGAFEAVEEALQRSRRSARPVALLLVDLDGFKSVNDSYGHAAGDRVLLEVARRLRAALRSGETLARLGADEFLVVSEPTVDASSAPALGQRLIREIERPFVDGETVFALSASVGFASGVFGDADAPELVRRADEAMFYAKQHGRGRVELFDAVRHGELGQQAALEMALRNAVRYDELELYVQPIVTAADGAPWGAEALVRWNRPGYAQVQPTQFIKIAEESSLILEIEHWVLSRACAILAGWQRNPSTAGLRLSVNVSGRHLSEGDLVGELDDILAATGADPHGLEVELTETQLLADVDHASVVLSQLRERGMQIAVDDFGTGWASMTYLRQLPIDTLKIDRFFVVRALEGMYDCTLIETLIQLGHTLDLNIVAEGVETSDQLDFVRVRGCQRIQGFYFARPMPLADADAWFAERCLVTL